MGLLIVFCFIFLLIPIFVGIFLGLIPGVLILFTQLLMYCLYLIVRFFDFIEGRKYSENFTEFCNEFNKSSAK